MVSVTEVNHGIQVAGHAGYGPAGYDIVCAGISALFLSLIESLEKLTSSEVESSTDFGNSYVSYKNEDEDTKLLIRSFLLGAEMIAEMYPDCVQVTRRECQ